MVADKLRRVVAEELGALKNDYDQLLLKDVNLPIIRLALEELLLVGKALSRFHKKFPVLALPAEESRELEMVDRSQGLDDSDADVTAIKALLKSRQDSFVTASYGYFLNPHYSLNRSLFRIAQAVPLAEGNTSDADAFKLLLPDYTITGIYEAVAKIEQEQESSAYQYGKLLYSEALYRTKTGSVISIPHLMAQSLPTLVAIFFLKSEEMPQLTGDTQSAFYQKTITPLTNLEKTCVSNIVYYEENPKFLSMPVLFLIKIEHWMQMKIHANNPDNIPLSLLLEALLDAIAIDKNSHICDAIEDYLKYWEIIGNEQEAKFYEWIDELFVNSHETRVAIRVLKRALIESVADNNFTSLGEYVSSIERLRIWVDRQRNSEIGSSYSYGTFIKWENVEKRNAYLAYFQDKVFKLHQLFNVTSEPQDSRAQQNTFSQCDKAVEILLKRAENQQYSFPLVIRSAKVIGEALKQLPVDDYSVFFSAIFNRIHLMLKTADDFNVILDSVRTGTNEEIKEKQLAVISKITYCLESFLNLNEKNVHQKQFNAFIQLAKALSAAKLKYVCSILALELNGIFFSIKRFNLILEKIDDPAKRKVLYFARKARMRPINGVDFSHIVQYLTPELCNKVYKKCKQDNMENIIKMITPKRALDSTQDETVYVHYKGFMDSSIDLQERIAITGALYDIITMRFIPIYTALRAGQEGILKSDFIKSLEKVGTHFGNAELGIKTVKVEFLLKYISKNSESRSAVAWELACDFKLVSDALFEKVRGVAIERAYGGGLLLNLMRTLIDATGTPFPANRRRTEAASDSELQNEAALAMKAALSKVGNVSLGA